MSRSKSITPAMLDFWIRTGLNVMFVGRRGVGKTAIVKESFERHGLKWKYFSAATMDPWCDFVGIPRAVNRDGRDVLEYVMSPDFTDDSVEALFFDEFNRSHKKVRDAVMELIQFKSINGRQFKNLKIVWAAINPVEEDDEKYQVEELDPAVLDRFHVHVAVPYLPDRKFFESKYGSEGGSAVSWWLEQPKSVQDKISPRRLEYGLIAGLAGNANHVFPSGVNVPAFMRAVKSGAATEVITDIWKKKDTKAAEKWLMGSNNIDTIIHLMKKNKEWWEFFLPLMPQEQLTQIMSKDTTLLKWMVKNEANNKNISVTLDNFENGTSNTRTLKWLHKNRVRTSNMTGGQWSNWAKQMKVSSSTYDRMKIVADIANLLKQTDVVSKLTRTDKDYIVETLAYFVRRSQRWTLIKKIGTSAGFPRGMPITWVKNILKAIGESGNTTVNGYLNMKGMGQTV